MFGSIISKAIRVVTLPIDVTNAMADKAFGGDGSKRSRMDAASPLSLLEELRDAAADTVEEIDNE